MSPVPMLYDFVARAVDVTPPANPSAEWNNTHTDTPNYGYVPSQSWATAWVVLFSVTALVHSAQALRSRYWVIYPTLVLGAMLEILGWAGRLWSSQNPLLLTPFLMQICTLIMAPVFFSAYCYTILGAAINVLGPQYSALEPRNYFIVFITADLVSLILQAIGGGQAASAAATSSPTKSATDIMVAGIIFQLCSMVVFVALGVDFILRASGKRPYAFQERRLAREEQRAAQGLKRSERKWWGRKRQDGAVFDDNYVSAEKQGQITAPPAARHDSADSASTRVGSPTPAVGPAKSGASAEAQTESQTGIDAHRVAEKSLSRWWIFLGAALFSSLMIICRGVYRSVELCQGWTGHLMMTEMYQNWLDAFVMLLAVGVFNFVHPLYLFGRKSSWKGYH